jgi:transketolase
MKRRTRHVNDYVTQMTTDTVERWRELGQQLRVDSIRPSAIAGSGHPTSGMSAAELMAVLVDSHLRFDWEHPENPACDRLIFSKGHASTLLYGIFRAAGVVDDRDLASYRTLGSPLEGHPTPVLPWVDVATGSLGQGLPIGVGMALAGRYLDGLPYRIWVLCGDSEMAEGSMWEAFEHASHYGLDNLTAIVDVNRLGQRGQTMVGRDTGVYAERARAFGWHAIEIDGHDVEQINSAYDDAIALTGRPTAIFASTLKGKGVPGIEDEDGWHGKPLADPDAAIEALGGVRNLHLAARPPEPGQPHRFPVGELDLPRWEVGASVATRQAYGEALAAIGAARGDVCVLDGEVSNSTFADAFKKAHPERFFEMYIAEQQMAAAAVGLQARGWRPFASTFGAFMARAYDFVRMAAVSRATLSLCGSHAGVSIGEDGPSQMALEDIACFRSIHGSTVLHPCDANQTAKLTAAMADLSGISYMRTLRPATPVIYGADQEFPIGGSRVLRSSDSDQVAILAAGITVHEALKAAEELGESGVRARVVDLYSIKPLDEATVIAAADATGGRLITAEDHWAEGGLGEAVLAALAGRHAPTTVSLLAVRGMPHSGKPAELMAKAGIDAAGIVSAAQQLVP